MVNCDDCDDFGQGFFLAFLINIVFWVIILAGANWVFGL